MCATVPHASHPDPDPPADAQAFTLPAHAADSFAQLRQDLMIHVANLAPDHVFLHAAVVAHRGRAIVLPGASFAGKTTLAAALVRAGAMYYSDEYAVLGPAGLIHPYSRDLQIRVPGSEVQTSTPVARLNGRAGTNPIAAALIAFVEYVPRACWQPAEVTPGMAVLEMLRHTIPVQRTPARVLSTLAALVSGARLLRSPRDEADSAAQHLLALVPDPHEARHAAPACRPARRSARPRVRA